MLIDEIAGGESETLEFKRDVPQDALKYIKDAVAFANSSGGRIVFGVDDDRTVFGVNELCAFKIADRIVDVISNKCTPQIPMITEVASIEDKTVIILSVMMGGSCPYYVKSLGKEYGTYIRVGATSRQAGEDALAELEFAAVGKSFDSQACRGVVATDSDIKKLCNRMYRVAKENCLDDAERKKVKKVTPTQLEDWGILIRHGSKVLPTNAYALLVGARKFHSVTKCGVFRGETKEIFIDSKECEESLIDQIEFAYDYVKSKINVGMKLIGTHRNEDYEIPPSAFRELIVNAVVHRSYINPRAMDVMVALFDDRLEIISPGGFLRGITLPMIMAGHSLARNKALAAAFKYMKFIEGWGSGIPRIAKKVVKAGLPPIEIENFGVDCKFTIGRRKSVAPQVAPVTSQVAPVAPMTPEVAPQKATPSQLSDCFADFPKMPNLNYAKILVLLFSGEKRRIEICDAICVSKKSRSVKLAFDKLISEGLVEFVRTDKLDSREQRYRLTEKGLKKTMEFR